jgi:hypothetical protein
MRQIIWVLGKMDFNNGKEGCEFLVNKTNRCTELQFIGVKILHVSCSLSAQHQFLAVHRHWYNLCSLVTVCYQA